MAITLASAFSKDGSVLISNVTIELRFFHLYVLDIHRNYFGSFHAVYILYPQILSKQVDYLSDYKK